MLSDVQGSLTEHRVCDRPMQAPAGGGFPTDFKDYPGGVEYFDVYHGPITSLYAQVWWTSTKNVSSCTRS